ncbi:hypothetical protein [Deinococcus hohokamensis]|uniref:Uncharacterized protein n=1 Tax=Deinococcus hohokamensis TaxID=309883 RepID=A0ABV9I8M1_9DEIO
MLRTKPALLKSPLFLPIGLWAPGIWRFARPNFEQVLLRQAFFSLEWMDEVL